MKRLLHWAGSLLAIVGAFFVCFRLYQYGHEIRLSRFSVNDWIFVFILAVIYGVSNLLLALSWRNLMTHLGVNISTWVSFRIFGLSQIAKYVPGNVFHFAGRQALGMAEGIPASPLLKSVFWEVLILSVAGCLFAFFVAPVLFENVSVLSGTVGFLGGLFALGGFFCFRFGFHIFAAFSGYVAFLALSGIIFLMLLFFVVEASVSDFSPLWAVIAGSYVVAWLIGMLTPGAPAGIGIREMVLIALLGSFVEEANLLLTIVVGRGVTVLGDSLYFVASHYFPSGKSSL